MDLEPLYYLSVKIDGDIDDLFMMPLQFRTLLTGGPFLQWLRVVVDRTQLPIPGVTDDLLDVTEALFDAVVDIQASVGGGDNQVNEDATGPAGQPTALR